MGRYGPYVKHGKTFVSIKKDNILEVTIERAVEIIKEQADNKEEKNKNAWLNKTLKKSADTDGAPAERLQDLLL